MSFSIIQIAHAHEEGATTVATDNILGPVLTLAIIILAMVVAKRIKRIKKSKFIMSKTIKMTLVTKEGCVHCAQTKQLLKKIIPEYPELEVREVDISTPEGQELIGKYSIMSSPGIIINDELFAIGGTTERELREKLDELKRAKRI